MVVVGVDDVDVVDDGDGGEGEQHFFFFRIYIFCSPLRYYQIRIDFSI